jgi:putative endonuclease
MCSPRRRDIDGDAFAPVHRHPGESRDLMRVARRQRYIIALHSGVCRNDGGDMGGWIYIMTDKPLLRALYRRVCAAWPTVVQHREGTGSRFCTKYKCTLLVLAEWHHRIEDAVFREKRLKQWQRAWKIDLVEQSNPEWRDLFDLISD